MNSRPVWTHIAPAFLSYSREKEALRHYYLLCTHHWACQKKYMQINLHACLYQYNMHYSYCFVSMSGFYFFWISPKRREEYRSCAIFIAHVAIGRLQHIMSALSSISAAIEALSLCNLDMTSRPILHAQKYPSFSPSMRMKFIYAFRSGYVVKHFQRELNAAPYTLEKI